MKPAYFSLLLVILFTKGIFAQCVGDENNVISFEVDEINYEIVKEKLNWESAAACAVERGGFLVEINSFEEQTGVYNKLKDANINTSQTTAPDGGGAAYVWTGGSDRVSEGTWLWDGNNDAEGIHFWQGLANGSAVDNAFVFWGNEPDNFSNQDALGIALTDWPFGNDGQWNDIRVINKLYFVIEYPDNSTGTDFISPPEQILLFPNPASDLLNMKIPVGSYKQPYSIQLINSLGTLVYSVEDDSPSLQLPTKSFESGTYYLKFISGKNALVQKLIIQ